MDVSHTTVDRSGELKPRMQRERALAQLLSTIVRSVGSMNAEHLPDPGSRAYKGCSSRLVGCYPLRCVGSASLIHRMRSRSIVMFATIGLATLSPIRSATRLDSGMIFSLPGVLSPTPSRGL